ncbi:unnamed protein product, partial [Phaeothamnion confervicola]
PATDAEWPAVGDISRLAHELRTPLGAIAVLAEIMRDERLGPLGSARYKGYAADIHQSALHANAVLAGWLEPSAGGRGQAGVLDFIELDLAELAGGTISALDPLAERAGVLLGLETSPNLPRVIADRRSVRQVLINLIANGMKFTPPGGQIEVRVNYDAGGPVTIEVRDSGDGMTPDELALARSRRPMPEALRRRSGGSGIGLPLVRALASACGAVFEIDSQRSD